MCVCVVRSMHEVQNRIHMVYLAFSVVLHTLNYPLKSQLFELMGQWKANTTRTHVPL